MRTLLLSLLAFSLAGSLARADSLEFKYTLHIDGVVLPGDGDQLPSIELAFLAGDDVRFGAEAQYFYGEAPLNNIVPLYLRESVSPSSPFYINPFVDFSAIIVGVSGIEINQDQFYMGDNVAGYDTNFGGSPTQVWLPGPGQTADGWIYGYSSTFEEPPPFQGPAESALTTYSLRLDMVPEPNAASLLALGLIGIVGLALWRRRDAIYPR